MSYSEQIVIEREKIEVFQKKIEQCKQRIASLEFLAQDADDNLDISALNKINNVTQASLVSGGILNEPHIPYIKEKTKQILALFGKEGASIDYVIKKANELNIEKEAVRIRKLVSRYKKGNGVLENPTPGFYRLSYKGILALFNEKPKKDETPVAETTDVSVTSTQAAAEGAKQSEDLI